MPSLAPFALPAPSLFAPRHGIKDNNKQGRGATTTTTTTTTMTTTTTGRSSKKDDFLLMKKRGRQSASPSSPASVRSDNGRAMLKEGKEVVAKFVKIDLSPEAEKKDEQPTYRRTDGRKKPLIKEGFSLSLSLTLSISL